MRQIFTAAVLLVLAGCGGGGSAGAPTPAHADPPITSEADRILHMDELRGMGFRGAGIHVGVISTGVVYLKSYQDAGLLPPNIYITQNTAGTLDEGSWMLELVHQHAPDAILGFCDGDDVDFYACLKDLAQNFHADVIVDDLLFAGQFYPDATASIVAQLETANDKLVFVHLSGNEENGGYWQGPFNALTGSIAGGPKTLLDWSHGFAADPFNTLTLPAGAHLNLVFNWNDPPHNGTANRALSAYLLDAQADVLAQVSGQDDPTVILSYTNPGAAQIVRVAVSLDGGPVSGLELQVTEGYRTCNIECQGMSYATSGLAGGTVGDFDDALVVGATRAQAPDVLEAWSNHGPFRLEFMATPNAAAADGFDYTRLPTPLSVQKPDLVSPDCVTTPFSDGSSLKNDQFLRHFSGGALSRGGGGVAAERRLQPQPGAQGTAQYGAPAGIGRVGSELRLRARRCRRRLCLRRQLAASAHQ